MKVMLAVLLGSFLLLGTVLADSQPGEFWPGLPDDTRVVVLLTGSDLGYYWPRGCAGAFGGAVYRPEFRAYLERETPGVEQIWLSTGEISHTDDQDPNAVQPRTMIDALAEAGYAGLGVGLFDLDVAGPGQLREHAAKKGVPLVTTNLFVYETGRPVGSVRRTIETGAGPLTVLAVTSHQPGRVWGDSATGTVVTRDPAASVREAMEEVHRAPVRPFVVLLTTQSGPELTLMLRELEVGDRPDFVAASRSGRVSATPETIASVPVLWLGQMGKFLGSLVLDGSGQVIDAHAVAIRGEFPIDPKSGQLRAPNAP